MPNAGRCGLAIKSCVRVGAALEHNIGAGASLGAPHGLGLVVKSPLSKFNQHVYIYTTTEIP
jgi:hypothetical protein